MSTIKEALAQITGGTRTNSTTSTDEHVKLCACGCGQAVSPGRTWRRGHHLTALHESRVTHGHTRGGKRSPTYKAWNGMVLRCTYPRHRRYVDFGGKGITVDPRWTGKDGFSQFLADMGERPEGMWIGRTDPNGPYSPENCEWMTPEQIKANEKAVS